MDQVDALGLRARLEVVVKTLVLDLVFDQGRHFNLAQVALLVLIEDGVVVGDEGAREISLRGFGHVFHYFIIDCLDYFLLVLVCQNHAVHILVLELQGS